MSEVQHSASHADDYVHRIFRNDIVSLASIDICLHIYVIFVILTVAKDTLKRSGFACCFVW